MVVTEINYQNIENTIPVATPVAGISAIKVDKQTSVMKTYLDSVTLVSISGSSGTSVDFDLVNASYVKIVGKYDWKRFTLGTGEGAILLPTQGTYLVTILGSLYTGASTICQIITSDSGGVFSWLTTQINALNPSGYSSQTFMFQAEAGDYLYFNGGCTTSGTDIRMKLSIIKLT